MLLLRISVGEPWGCSAAAEGVIGGGGCGW